MQARPQMLLALEAYLSRFAGRIRPCTAFQRQILAKMQHSYE